MPAREAKQRYSSLTQTGTVKQYVHDMMEVVRELEGTVFHPGGCVFDDFIDGLKPSVQRFVQDNAPSGWWTNIRDLYQKALDYELNGVAGGRSRESGCQRSDTRNCADFRVRYAGTKRARDESGAEQGRQAQVAKNNQGKRGPPAVRGGRGSGRGGRDAGRGGQGRGNAVPDNGVCIPPAEWDARRLAGVCYACGKEGHSFKGCTTGAPKS